MSTGPTLQSPAAARPSTNYSTNYWQRDSCGKHRGLSHRCPTHRPVTPYRDDAGSAARAQLGPVRRFVDGDGIHWRVFEHRALFDRRSRASLIFESTNVVRRVRGFPENWFELTDEQLARISQMR